MGFYWAHQRELSPPLVYYWYEACIHWVYWSNLSLRKVYQNVKLAVKVLVPILGVRTVYASRASNDLWANRRHVCIAVSRRGKCFCDSRSCATISVTKCEKDGKAYAERVHWIPESKRYFEYLTKREDMVVSQDGHSLLCLAAALSYSSISLRTSQVSEYLSSPCLHFRFFALVS